MLSKISLALLLCAAPLMAQEAEESQGKTHLYTPPSRMFSCEMPRSWQSFEEEDALGSVARLMGPNNQAGTFRAGFSVRWIDKDMPGFVETKKAVELARRDDKALDRHSTPVRLMRAGNALARVFEITQKHQLPEESLPSNEDVIHQDVAVIPSGAGYYWITLSSTQDLYLDYRSNFLQCLKTFQPLGR